MKCDLLSSNNNSSSYGNMYAFFYVAIVYFEARICFVGNKDLMY